MCRAVKCRICGKTTWAGCGDHVEQVLGSVPHDQRCQGHDKVDAGGGGWLKGLLRRA